MPNSPKTRATVWLGVALLALAAKCAVVGMGLAFDAIANSPTAVLFGILAAHVSPPQLLTPKDVAARHRCKVDRVRFWIRSGLLKALRSPGSKRPRFKIRPSDLEAFERSLEFVPAEKAERRRTQKPADADFISYY